MQLGKESDRLQQPDRRHHRWRHHQPGQDQEVDHPVPARLAALENETDHGREDDQERDAGHGQDGGIDEGRHQHPVPRGDDFHHILPEMEARGPGEIEKARLLLVLDRGQDDEGEGDQEHHRRDQDGDGVEPVATQDVHS